MAEPLPPESFDLEATLAQAKEGNAGDPPDPAMPGAPDPTAGMGAPEPGAPIDEPTDPTNTEAPEVPNEGGDAGLPVAEPDAGSDPDAGPADAGSEPDAGDASAPDAGAEPDAGDAGEPDGGSEPDAGDDAGEPSAPDPLSTDRVDFWGDSRCDALDSLFCDGFEGASLDSAWQKEGTGTATIVSGRSARGSKSLHVHTTGNGFSFLRLTSIFPVTDNRYYGRMFVRFEALPDAPTWAHWTIAEASGTGDGSLVRLGGQLDNEHNRFGVGSDKGPTGDWTRMDSDGSGGTTRVPEDTWLCVEWMHDGSADETRFYVDAVERPSLATASNDHEGSGTYDLPALESVWIGWWLYQPDPDPGEFDVWIDEVAFGEDRIGCVY